jgi:hypothetical protein
MLLFISNNWLACELKPETMQSAGECRHLIARHTFTADPSIEYCGTIVKGTIVHSRLRAVSGVDCEGSVSPSRSRLT